MVRLLTSLALALVPLASPPAQDAVGPLVEAASKGDLTAVRGLAAPSRLAGRSGWREHAALHAAADAGHRDVVEFLLEAGAPIDQPSGRGWTPLALACARGHVDVVERLLAGGADAAPADAERAIAPLLVAADAGHARVVRALLEAGAPTTSRDARGMSALHLAASEGHAEVAELLLDHAASLPLIEATDRHGRTPVHAAAASGEAELARALIAAGALSAPRDAAGWTPLHVAAASGVTPAALEALAACPGTDPDARDPLGRTAADLARIRDAGGAQVEAPGALLPADLAGEDEAPLLALARTVGYPGPVTPPHGLLLAVWADGTVVVAADPARAGEALGVARLDAAPLAHLRATVAASGIFDLPETRRIGMHAPENRLVWPVGAETRRHQFGSALSFHADAPAEDHPGTRALVRALRDLHAALAVALPPAAARTPLARVADAGGRFRGYDPDRPFQAVWLH